MPLLEIFVCVERTSGRMEMKMNLIFDRALLKARAKANLKRNYWSAFVVTLLLALIGGGVSGFGSSFNFNVNVNENTTITVPAPQPNENVQLVVAIVLLVLCVVLLLALVVAVLKSIYVGAVMQVGGCRFFLNYTRGSEKFGDIIHGFSAAGTKGYFNVVKVMFRYHLYLFLLELPLALGVGTEAAAGILRLTNESELLVACNLLMAFGSVLCLIGIVPAILSVVKAYEFSMIPYLLAEYPDMPAREAMQGSKDLTMGHKWDLFVLELSFLGWMILGALCFGIGTLFVAPYVSATMAEAYVTLCNLRTYRQSAVPPQPWQQQPPQMWQQG